MRRYVKKMDEEEVIDVKIRTRSMSERKKLKITKVKTTPYNVYELRNRRCRRINSVSSSARYCAETTTFEDPTYRNSSSCSSGTTASVMPSNASRIAENCAEIAVEPEVEIALLKSIDCNNSNNEIETTNDLGRAGMDGVNTPATSTVQVKPLMIMTMMPSEAEIEEFFSSAEKDLQKRFSDKYNFDVVKDVALKGRYDWVQIENRYDASN